MTEGWVDYLTGPYGFAFAFAAGLLSFLSPCVLPLVPAYLAHLTGAANSVEPGAASRRETVSHAATFVLGFAAAFSLLGASAGLLGAMFGAGNSGLVRDHQRTLEHIAGVVLIVLGLNLMGVIRIPFLYRTYALQVGCPVPATAGATVGGGVATVVGGGNGVYGIGYMKSFAVGTAFAIGWTPCLGPVLGAIFTLSATTADVAQGFYLLLVYSLGLGVPFIITGLAVVPMARFFRSIRGLMPLVEIIAGGMVVLVGVLIFLNKATVFNGIFTEIPFLERLNNI